MDVLDEVELLIGAGRPEILTVVDQVLALLVAFFVGKRHGRFSAERRVREYIVIAHARIGEQRVVSRDGNHAVKIADVVQKEVHQAQAIGGANDLPTVEGFILEKLLLVSRELIVTGDISLRGKKETAAAAGGVYVPADFDTKKISPLQHHSA